MDRAYSPLLPGHIRLLEIKPPRKGSTQRGPCGGSKRGPVAFASFRSVKLSSLSSSEGGHRYAALSYVWGKSKATRCVDIDGWLLPVQPNLANALAELASNPSPDDTDSHIYHGLWVDALCINQNDDQERTNQIQLMDKIYSQAALVIAWLGKSPPELFKQVSRRYHQSVEAMRIDNEDEELQSGLAKRLGSNAWFKRIWTLQEIVLPEKAVLRYGSFEIDRKVMLWSLREIILPIRANVGQPSLETVKDPKTPSSESFGKNLPVGVLVKRNYSSMWDIPRHLLGLIDLTVGRKATNPRDRIIGLLGLCQASTSRWIVPDYKSSRGDFNRQVTYAIAKEMNSLKFISLSADRFAKVHNSNGILQIELSKQQRRDRKLLHERTPTTRRQGHLRSASRSEIYWSQPSCAPKWLKLPPGCIQDWVFAVPKNYEIRTNVPFGIEVEGKHLKVNGAVVGYATRINSGRNLDLSSARHEMRVFPVPNCIDDRQNISPNTSGELKVFEAIHMHDILRRHVLRRCGCWTGQAASVEHDILGLVCTLSGYSEGLLVLQPKQDSDGEPCFSILTIGQRDKKSEHQYFGSSLDVPTPKVEDFFDRPASEIECSPDRLDDKVSAWTVSKGLQGKPSHIDPSAPKQMLGTGSPVPTNVSRSFLEQAVPVQISLF